MIVFCDYLTVTCHPEQSFIELVSDWLTPVFPIAFQGEDLTVFRVGRGKIDVDSSARLFHRVSCSGSSLSELRSTGEYGGFLSLLGSVPHRVTRLDAAIDVLSDAPAILRALESRYPSDKVCLTRKALKVTRMYTTRSDGHLSGTWYAGHKSRARVTARVYDKQLEAYERHGEIIPPTTRYELTFGRDHGCTLKDAFMPRSLFYEYASPALVERPGDHRSWSPHNTDGWDSDPVDRELTYEMFLRRVENSPELAALERMAASLGPVGVDLYLASLRRRLSHLDVGSELQQSERSEA